MLDNDELMVYHHGKRHTWRPVPATGRGLPRGGGAGAGLGSARPRPGAVPRHPRPATVPAADNRTPADAAGSRTSPASSGNSPIPASTGHPAPRPAGRIAGVHGASPRGRLINDDPRPDRQGRSVPSNGRRRVPTPPHRVAGPPSVREPGDCPSAGSGARGHGLAAR